MAPEKVDACASEGLERIAEVPISKFVWSSYEAWLVENQINGLIAAQNSRAEQLSDLPTQQQRKLVKWMLKYAVFHQSSSAPFGTPPEQMAAKFAWYPQSVEWTSPLDMPLGDLEVMFEAFVRALQPMGAVVVRDFSSRRPLEGQDNNDKAASLLRQRLLYSTPIHRTLTFHLSHVQHLGSYGRGYHARLSRCFVAGAPVIAQPLINIDGKAYLPEIATDQQIIDLLNRARPSDGQRSRRSADITISGKKVSLAALYNTMQKSGGNLVRL